MLRGILFVLHMLTYDDVLTKDNGIRTGGRGVDVMIGQGEGGRRRKWREEDRGTGGQKGKGKMGK